MSFARFGTRVRWVFTIAAILFFVLAGLVIGQPPVIPGLIAATALTAGLWAVRDRLPTRLRPSALQLLVVFWVVLFFGALSYDYVVNLPPTERESARLETELQQIPQPSLAVRASLSVDTKPGSALVDAIYTGPIGWPELRSHFDRILGADGWTLEEDRPLLDWGADKGGRTACYRKGNDLAHVELASVGSGYTYSFSLWWHPRPEAC